MNSLKYTKVLKSGRLHFFRPSLVNQMHVSDPGCFFRVDRTICFRMSKIRTKSSLHIELSKIPMTRAGKYQNKKKQIQLPQVD